MAPSAGSLHVLVARNLKNLRLACNNASRYVQSQLQTAAARQQLEPVYARVAPRQPLHPAALIKQSRRWFTNQAFTASARQHSAGGIKSVKLDRSALPTSRIGTFINLGTGRAPFAHTLRPNLTGGALGRTAGGYTMGAGHLGGARFFSHGPAAPAQVIQNVNQAIRAFVVGGKKAQFAGINPHNGNKHYKEVTHLQSMMHKRISDMSKSMPGSRIQYSVNPSITALTPFGSVTGFKEANVQNGDHLNTEGLLDILAIDFSRALKELAVVLSDLKRLSALGDLPITYQDSYLCVHFPGCDADSVERIATELNLRRGIIQQDKNFDECNGTDIALLFPFAPSNSPSECSFYEKPDNHRHLEERLWRDDPAVQRKSPASPSPREVETFDYSTLSDSGLEFGRVHGDFVAVNNPWPNSPNGYETIHSSELTSSHNYEEGPALSATPLDYEGMEGLYRFMEQLDAAERRR